MFKVILWWAFFQVMPKRRWSGWYPEHFTEMKQMTVSSKAQCKFYFALTFNIPIKKLPIRPFFLFCAKQSWTISISVDTNGVCCAFNHCFCSRLTWLVKMSERRCRGVAKNQNVNKSQNDIIGRRSSIFIRGFLIEFKGQKLKERVDIIKLI